MARTFTVSATPHVRDRATVPGIMYSVVLALLPALAGAIYFFGIRAVWIVALTTAVCVATEGIIQKLAGKPMTIRDGSAIVTGVLLSFNLPPGIEWWIPVLGGVFAIAVAKMLFGGLGQNPLNPALAARVFLLISFPVQMTTTWLTPTGFSGVDAETTTTPLNLIKQLSATIGNRDSLPIETVNAALSRFADIETSFTSLFIGNRSGCIGETSVLLLLIGGTYLVYKRIIDWRIPFFFIGTVGVLAWAFGSPEGYFQGPWLFHVLSGGLFLGAFFMATDMVTSPITLRARIIYAVGCGALTVMIRLVGGFPEGVSFAILLMNLTVPLLDRYTKPAVFGKAVKRA